MVWIDKNQLAHSPHPGLRACVALESAWFHARPHDWPYPSRPDAPKTVQQKVQALEKDLDA